MAGTAADSIGTRTVRGMFWSYGSFVGVRLASFVTTAVLARLLLPKDFGLIAAAMTFMAFLDMIQGLGVGEALVVSDPDRLANEADTAFALSSGMGLVLWLASAALGPAAAALFHQPRMVEIMPALGLTFLIYGLGSTHYSLAMRGIDFRSRTYAEIADAIVRGGVGVALAVAGAGVWALVAGYVAGAVAMTIVVWKLVQWQPRWRLEREHMRRLLGFGGALTAVGIMGAFLNQFDNAVVGRVLGPTELGFYSIANRLPYLLIISLAAATGQVLFPAFAALDGEALARGFLTSLRYTAMVALPLTAVLITLAEAITLAVFGPHWRGAIVATQVLCLWALMSPISMVCGNAIKSRGRAGLLLALAVPQAIVLVVGSLLLVHQGIVAIAWVQAAIAIIAQVVTLVIACRMLGISAGGIMRSIGPPLVASAVLAGVLLGVRAVLSGPWPTVIAGGIVGAVVYLGVLHLVAPDLLPSLRQLAFPRRSRVGTPDTSAAGEPPAAAQEPPAAVTRS
jgi:PST family polysaccharide transporter